MNFLLPILYILGLYSAYLAGSFYLRVRSAEQASASETRTFPRTTLVLFLLVAIPTILQFFFPVFLSRFQRDSARFMDGEWWRLLTFLFVQDGGISGTVSCLLRRPPRLVQVAALLALGADITLVFLKDIHGPAALTGAILALAIIWMSKQRWA